MTAVIILFAFIVVAEVLAGVRILHRDRPRSLPRSHADWSWNNLPSHPYSRS